MITSEPDAPKRSVYGWFLSQIRRLAYGPSDWDGIPRPDRELIRWGALALFLAAIGLVYFIAHYTLHAW